MADVRLEVVVVGAGVVGSVGGRWLTIACGIVVLGVALGGVFPAWASGPGGLRQTRALPAATSAFRARMEVLWAGIVRDSPREAIAAFFPRAAYLQVKAIRAAGSDYDGRLLASFRLDVRAAHKLVSGGGRATFLYVSVPREWAWIPPGSCYNKVGYWHAPGARLVYRQDGRIRSFGIYSLISWRGQWYVVHLGVWNKPGTIVDPATGVGVYGPAGGC
jgi:hypothetical protein